ncbi:amino acid adenylation domain-containing protein [Pseudomonas entomophila]|uniref:non-ribosomal peptide synthetase n=1 Tax=Pseudomonas entomophila TaxID=312306 RepID=UPI0023D805A7|nr:non-ribosomal peptide synthetase [Pseudomonas entomophila]MDF0733008.1 amino acid adenylation domain-containing protein [Pseudomonas entomophila]
MRTAKFDLTLELGELEGRLVGVLEYATALFDESTMRRHMGYLERMLEAMAAEGEREVGRVALLDEAERAQVLQAWNATEVAHTGESSVSAMFEAQVARTPDALAVEAGEVRLSYRELNEQANQLAHRLIELGVGADDRVALCVERGAGMVVGLLGILKSGAGYVPLDPAYPSERLAWMLEDSTPSALVVSEATRGVVEDAGVQVVDLDDAAWRSQPVHDPRVTVQPHHLAYVIYTSGSTGRPKGVMIEHRQTVNFLNWAHRSFDKATLARTLFSTSLSFDLAVYECFAPLTSGGSVVVVNNVLDLRAGSLGVSLVNTVPSALKALLDEGRALDEVGTVNVAGEALRRELVEQVFAQTPIRRINNLYGPSETTTYSSWVSMDRESGFLPHIGRPIDNTQFYLLDAHGEPVPMGVAGEIYIGGAGVARGYLNREDLTAERFLTDPFRAGGRMYRTGDLGRWLPGGEIEYLGRNDHQVKVRGFRIELGEIEARLAQVEGVREAVVLARMDTPGEPRLVAYLTGESIPETGALRDILQANLPEYMLPVAYVRLDALPLTPNGKLDRGALPAPGADAFDAHAYEAPVGPLETTLAGIWSQLLGVERVGRDDDFFHLGGQSLKVVQLISQVRRQLGVEVELGKLFARPRLAAMAQTVSEAASSQLPAIAAVSRDDLAPLSFAQQRLWFLAQMEGGSAAYHICAGLRLRGELDVVALHEALDRIVARHEALRTRFVMHDGEAWQCIAPSDAGFSLAHQDLSDDPDRESRIAGMAGEEASAAFDLTHGPLIRGRLIRLSGQDHVLLVTMHHIISDGWSLGILTRELAAFYAACRRSEPDSLPPLPIQYADYALWQRRWLDAQVMQQQGAWWESTLAGAPGLLSLPTDRPRPARQDYRGASLEVCFDEALTAGLKDLARRHGATLFMVVQAGWAAVLGRLAGQDDVVVGVPVANRTRSETEGLIGFFVNTLALRVDLSGAPSVAELLGRVRHASLAAQMHQDLPFEQVVERVNPVRSLAHSPLFQASLTWQNTDPLALSLGDAQLEGIAAPRDIAKFDVALELAEMDGRIVGSFDYATALFDPSTMQRHLGYLERMLRAMVQDDGIEVARIALLDERERQQLLYNWNATGSTHYRGETIAALFEAQAAKSPDAVALVHGDGSWTYRELDRRANRLARHLQALGVGIEDRVALCAGRGLSMVTGLLGILKAGAAYVPIDAAHPPERMAYILADSEPKVVLVEAATRDLIAAGHVVIDLDQQEWTAYADDAPQVPGLGPDHLAYVIYTSGSTGRPKGVEATIGGLGNRLQWFIRDVLDAAPVTALKTSIGFVDSVTETLGALLAGGRLVTFDDATVRDVARFGRQVAASGVDHLVVVPSLLKHLVASDMHGLEALATLVCSGERLAPELAERFAARYPRTRLLNFYGSSEVNGEASFFDYRDATPVCAHSIIGRPIANMRVYVLDAHGEPVPTGTPGEIHVAGASVARGYLNLTELSASSFTVDPFHRDARQRMYRTGDIGCWLANGNLAYLGRNDNQIKLRGFRVEPGEIEASLSACEGVREAIVMARPDATGEPRLIAWYTGTAVAPGVLRERLHARLQAYMLPSAFVHLAALPLTSNGKLDRRALPEPTVDAQVRTAYHAPQGETETQLAGIWGEVLGVERVGRHDDFFLLGGHSLQAVHLTARLGKAGFGLTLADVFQHTTVAEMAQAIARPPAHEALVSVRTGGSARPLFLVHELAGLDAYAASLAAHIDETVPVYALAAVPVGMAQLRTIEEMAARLKDAMRTVQAEGPYRIAGWSFGGVLAYEIALQLVGEDQPVEFVGLLDSRHPRLVSAGKQAWEASAQPQRAQLLEWCAQTADPAWLAEDMDFDAVLQACRRQGLLPQEMLEARDDEIREFIDRIVAHGYAQAHYAVAPLPVPLHLFVAGDEWRAGETQQERAWLGWDSVLPESQLTRVVLPGDHRSMVLAHPAQLGQALSDALRVVSEQPPRRLAEREPTLLLTIGAATEEGERVVCVPGAGDSVVRFLPFARALDGECLVQGLQPRGVDGKLTPHMCVEAAAASHLSALARDSAGGPLHLVGHSFGGWIAFEMAARLQAAGRPVESLMLLDSQGPGIADAGILGAGYTADEALLQFVDAMEIASGQSLGLDAGMLARMDGVQALEALQAAMVRAKLLPARTTVDALSGPVRTFAAALRTRYRPVHRFDGPACLVLAFDPRLSRADNERDHQRTAAAWRLRVPNLTVSVVDADHFSLLKSPHVERIAAAWMESSARFEPSST